jgi:multiple sugar transport system ATP-binding protein
MNHGRIHQVGTPEACYRAPGDTFVASFLGSPAMNFLDANTDDPWVVLAGGERIGVSADVGERLAARRGVEVRVGIRPEDIHASSNAVANPVRLGGRVVLREPLGHETLTHLRLDGAPESAVPVVARGQREFEAGPGGETSLFLDASRLHIFWKDTLQRVDAAREVADRPSAGAARA